MKTQKTEWGVTLGIKKAPPAELVVYGSVYGYRIDKHGIMAFGETADQCRENYIKAYKAETGQHII